MALKVGLQLLEHESAPNETRTDASDWQRVKTLLVPSVLVTSASELWPADRSGCAGQTWRPDADPSKPRLPQTATLRL